MGIGVVFNQTACFPGHFAERISLRIKIKRKTQ